MLSSVELREGDIVEYDSKKHGQRNGFRTLTACQVLAPPAHDVPSTTPIIVLKVVPPELCSSSYYAVLMLCEGVIFLYLTNAARSQRIWRKIG